MYSTSSATWLILNPVRYGDKYEGEFKVWEWHGHGRLSLAGGHQIVGEFEHFEPWQTKEYNDSGEMICENVNGVQTRANS